MGAGRAATAAAAGSSPPKGLILASKSVDHRAGASGQHPTCHGVAKGTVQIGHEAQIRGGRIVDRRKWAWPLLMFHMTRGQIADRAGNVGGRV